MLRRNARQRKEYLSRKGLEQIEKNSLERSIRFKEALDEGKLIPTEYKSISDKIVANIDLIDTSIDPKSIIDDEYSLSGLYEPKILITTSRSPSNRLLQFVKELNLIVPNSFRINRGGYVLKDFGDLCRSNGATDLIVVHEHRGEPDGLIISHFPHGPTAYFTLNNVVLRHDLPLKPSTVSQSNPHLIFQNFNSILGGRVSNILKYLFPRSKNTSQRVISFININDNIIFRHFNWVKDMDNKSEDLQLNEIGPRFILKLYKIELGTLEMKNLSTEWVHRPFFNKKKTSL
ncbi:IMP4 U3 small nucleolar ribonucleoprotein [Cryptosporidium ubiquitum]|uniref:IMP4 U3 small nucleolar ribonucleoprotein n=1 Tax=Cryptosporidium ubiquitum TaxID=857276 RepID=A0A1J4MD06_9CRYT|nr:IMP4 U3 small nucleolar ribonucleoprotein [Cryptosporidium ubiquitum]OII72102.1 IMP4 U3 small nucleolar ribonucleoprotein [Cryptosporidium ubiquitum]